MRASQPRSGSAGRAPLSLTLLESAALVCCQHHPSNVPAGDGRQLGPRQRLRDPVAKPYAQLHRGGGPGAARALLAVGGDEAS